MLIVFSRLSVLIASPLFADSGSQLATRVLPWPCEESRPKAQEYFRERNIDVDAATRKRERERLIGESECANCLGLFFVGDSKYSPHPLDAHGKPLGGTFSALRRYTVRPRFQPRIYSDWGAYGVLVLKEASGGCSATLVFKFTAVRWPLIPIMDGEEEELDTNGHLEAEYLEGISKISK